MHKLEEGKKYYCDFHCHSNHSDGKLSRREVIKKAIEQNEGATMILAITDHNVPFEDMEELKKEFEGQILLISGSEVSTTYPVPETERKVEVHINALNYRLDHPGFLRMLKKNKHDKREIIELILGKLEARGLHVVDAYEELVEYVKPSTHVGRMAIARKMFEKGLVASIDEAFDKYFGSYGERLCYVDSPYEYVSIEEAVKTIREAGGIPVLCHPYFYGLEEEQLRDLIQHFKDVGGLAIETEYGFYTEEQRAKLRKLAKEFELAISCGSDYHGNAHERLDYRFDGKIYEGLANKNNKLILTSYGLTTKIGRKLIGKELEHYDLAEKKIFLFHEPHYSIETMLVEACLRLGFQKKNIILSGQQKNNEEVLECDFYYCTEGNTFEVLALMRERGLDLVIKDGFADGNKIYIGCSAGAAIAGVSIEEVKGFDRNFIGMTDFSGLGLFDGIIIPHYTATELKCYINSRPGIKEKYKHIYFVENEKSLVLDV